MEIKFTEKELQFLTDNFSGADIKLHITGAEKFTIIHPKADITCEILGIKDRSVVIGYNLGFWKNLFFDWFIKFEKEGILWDKKQKFFEINPFSFLPEKEKLASAEFSIEEVSIVPGSLLIRLGVIPKQQKKALQISSEGS